MKKNPFPSQISWGIYGTAENSQLFLHKQWLSFHFFKEENQFDVKMHQILLRQNRVSKDNFESIWNVLFCQMITGRGKIKMVFGSTFVIGLCKSLWWREGDVGQDLWAQDYHKIWIGYYFPEWYRKKPKRLVGNIFLSLSEQYSLWNRDFVQILLRNKMWWKLLHGHYFS